MYNKIVNREERISVVGLGYVGMPLAVAFAKKADVVGFDINKAKVQGYLDGKDETNEVGDEVIKNTTVDFTWDEEKLKTCKFHIIAVPTPINGDKTPDLRPIIGSSTTVGRNLVKGSIVVYESTVYPGVTESLCVPILEKESGLKCGEDFFVGYSPERINPGDKIHRLETIVKIVSGQDEKTLDTVAKVYELVVEAGVHRAESIKVAEAAKVIENSQRDINIAFMNELAIIFNKMGIDTKAVLEAAGTKWNFLNFTPGLVGGHCIGVDPFYLVYKAKEVGYESQIIASGRKINDYIGKFVAENVIKNMIKAGKVIKGSKVAILGFTFKEDCPDTRNTKVIDIVNELMEYGVEVVISDPIATNEEVVKEYGLELVRLDEIKDVEAVVVAVPHKEYKELSLSNIKELYSSDSDQLLFDVKAVFNKKEAESKGLSYWRL